MKNAEYLPEVKCVNVAHKHFLYYDLYFKTYLNLGYMSNEQAITGQKKKKVVWLSSTARP